MAMRIVGNRIVAAADTNFDGIINSNDTWIDFIDSSPLDIGDNK